MRVRVLTRPDRAAGFQLAGLEVRCVDTDTAAAAVLVALAAERDVGIVLVDDRLHAALPRELLTRFERDALPIVVAVPSPSWDERRTAEAYVMEILRRAVGYRVRPR